MKQADTKLICALRGNSRSTLTSMSKEIRIPISTIYDKMKKYEKSFILKYTTLIDFSKVGYSCRANIMLKVNIAQKDKLKGFLKEYPCVNNLYKINNGFDFLAEVIFCTVVDLDIFLEQIEKMFLIEEKRVFYTIEDLKREEFVSFGIDGLNP